MVSLEEHVEEPGGSYDKTEKEQLPLLGRYFASRGIGSGLCRWIAFIGGHGAAPVKGLSLALTIDKKLHYARTCVMKQ
jgi:hypothetical protein